MKFSAVLDLLICNMMVLQNVLGIHNYLNRDIISNTMIFRNIEYWLTLATPSILHDIVTYDIKQNNFM